MLSSHSHAVIIIIIWVKDKRSENAFLVCCMETFGM